MRSRSRRAFAVRGWSPENPTAPQMFTIACDFGVGYATLLTHLSFGVNMISRVRARRLTTSTECLAPMYEPHRRTGRP
jgi:hypothetical protein